MVALEFVSISHPDEIRRKENKRKIGQHVMKDIGYSRRKTPLKKKGKPRQDNEQRVFDKVQTLSKALGSDTPTNSDHETPFKQSPFTALSRNLAARSARIENLLSRDNSPMCKKQRELYYTVAMLDDGVFQLALADAVLYELVQPVGRFRVMEESPVAMRHYTASVAIVNQRIRDGSSISQTLVGTIVALASYDLIVRNFERWAMHMKGLQDVMEMRGGVTSLGSMYLKNAMVWTDTCGSLNTDMRPHFTSDSQPQTQGIFSRLSNGTLPMTLQRTFGVLQHRSQGFDEICTVLMFLSELSKTASSNLSEEWLQDERLVQQITEASHSVLNLPRQGQQPDLGNNAALHEAIRLAALLFIMGPAFTLSGEKDLMLGRVGRIPSLLEREMIDWTGLEELELWVLFLGARIEEGRNRKQLISRLCRRLEGLSLGLKGLERVLREIVWIDDALRTDNEMLSEQIKLALLGGE